MLPFIRGGESPTQSFHRNRAADQQAELSDLRIGEARRADRVARAVDVALGQADAEAGAAAQPQVPVPAGMDQVAAANLQTDPGAAQFKAPQQQGQPQQTGSPGERLRAVRANAAQRLMKTPGARAEAMGMMSADAHREEQIMRQTFELAKTDPQQAKLYAQQFGFNLPPAMEAALNDRGTVVNWTRAMDAAAKTYPDPHQSGKRFQFAQQYFRGLNSGGGVSGAVANAPAPSDTPRYAPQLTHGVDASGQSYQMVFDPNTGKMEPTGYKSPSQPSPQYLYAQDGTVFQNRGGVAVPVKTEAGEPFKGTGLRSAGARTTSIAPNPQNVRMRALAWVDRQKDFDMPLFETPQQREAAIRAYEKFITTGDYTALGQAMAQAVPAEKAQEPGFLQRLFGSVEQDAQATAGPGEQSTPIASAAPAGQSPFPEYPDARQANDGNWYVQRNGQTFKVTE
jgi:hypothetical protein